MLLTISLLVCRGASLVTTSVEWSSFLAQHDLVSGANFKPSFAFFFIFFIVLDGVRCGELDLLPSSLSYFTTLMNRMHHPSVTDLELELGCWGCIHSAADCKQSGCVRGRWCPRVLLLRGTGRRVAFRFAGSLQPNESRATVAD